MGNFLDSEENNSQIYVFTLLKYISLFKNKLKVC